MYNIGDRVRIKDTYPGYKSMRGMVGEIIWLRVEDELYQVQTATIPRWMDHNFCFVQPEYLEEVKP